MFKLKAIGVSEGLAHAKALVIREADLTVVKDTITDVAAEQQRVLDAVEKAKKQIETLRDEAERISARQRRKSSTRTCLCWMTRILSRA